MKKYALLLGLSVISCAITGCMKESSAVASDSEVEQATPEKVIQVSVAKVETQDIEQVLLAIGSFESFLQPSLAALANGSLKEVFVDEGDRVEQGQVLATIDDELYRIQTEAASAELRRLSALVENQDREVVRLRTLAKQQSISKDHMEDEESQLAVLTAQRDIAANALEEARYRLDKTRVRAPFDGHIVGTFQYPGSYVQVGDRIFDLVTLDILRARLTYPERDAKHVQVGKEVRLSSPSNPDVVTTGQVKSVKPVINPGSRAIEAVVQFNNPGGWLPGSTVDAELLVSESENVAVVPQAAVVNRPAGKVVYVLGQGNRVSERVVTTGSEKAAWVEVIKGVQEGEQVVVDGVKFVTEGSLVNVVQ